MQMNFSIFFKIFCVSILIAIAFGQDDGKQYCQSAIQCYEEAEKLNGDCQAANKPANTSAANPTDCKALLNDKVNQLREKERQHRQMMIDCLKTRVDEAMPVPHKEAIKCQNASTPASSSGSSSGGGSGSSQRFVRQTTNTTDVSSTDMGSSGGGSDSSGANGATGGTGVTASTGSNGGNGSGSGQGKGKGKDKGKGSGNRPNKDKGKPNGNVCQQKVQQKQAQCKKMDNCCSEIPYCHLKFELSDLHDQIRGLELDILLQRRKCQQQQPQQQNGTKAPTKPLGPLGNNITSN